MTRRFKRTRFLPEYVTSYDDRHGKKRYRFRRKGYEQHTFKGKLGTEEFRAEYAACMEAKLDEDTSVVSWRSGSVGDLVTRYVSVPARLGPTASTQAKVRAIVEKFRDEFAEAFVIDFTFEHIDKLIERTRIKVKVEREGAGSRWSGGIEAARKLRKELVRLFDYAEKIGMRPKGDNPVKHAEHVTVARGQRSKGFHSWTEDDIAAYRAHHALGTAARLAMELLLWTGQRRGDGYLFGPDDISDGRFAITQNKSGKELWIPVAPQLLEAITAMPPPPPGAKAFLLSQYGKPFTNGSFGNRMRKWCDSAGLPKCTSHGLRKANARRMAELGMTNQTLKSVGGWTNDREVAIYVAGASQAKLAEDAIARLSAWERNRDN